jgi:HNH endonuclease
MAKRPLPDQATLLKLLRYEPETGKLYWCERDRTMFKSNAGFLSFNSCWAGKEAFTSFKKGYRYAAIPPYGNIYAHRAIWCMTYGYWPEMLDHADQDRSNNRLGNLSEVTRVENGRNCKLSVRNRSGRIGVNWRARDAVWRAKIRHDGRYIELGRFKSFEEACAARSLAEQQFGYNPLHGRRTKR